MTVPFSWELPYAWPRKPVLARNVVCTSQPLAAQAGLAMLADGGNAVDAALAAAITLTLVEPVSNGIGSDAFAIVWDGEKLHGLNASGRSPAAWTPEYFGGGPVPARGWNSVTVPGAVSAWTELHARFGRLPFARIFEPAIRYGRDGFLVSPTVAAQWAKPGIGAAVTAGFAEAFLAWRTGAGAGGAVPASRARRDAGDDRRHGRGGVLSGRAGGEDGGAFDRERRRDAGLRPRRAPRRTGSTRSASTTAATRCTRSRRTVRASSR